MKEIHIREYIESDAQYLVNIYYHTIHTINTRDYTQEQVDAWAPITSLEVDGWKTKWLILKPLVAVVGDDIVGFAEFEANGHIDCFYCHHDWIRKGVGSVLLEAIEAKAAHEKIQRIYAEVSITAKPFFESKGFNVVKAQTIQRRGVELNNYVMEKKI